MTENALRRARVNGVDLAYLDEGEGAPVLLIHGFPDDHCVWRHQIPALVAAGYRVIAPDTRGCGQSEAPLATADYRLSQLVEDMRALLDHLGLDRVRLVGHDWGSIIGWRLAETHPQRIEAYAALSVGHPSAYARGGLMQKLKGYYVLMFQLRGVAERLVQARDWAAVRAMVGSPEDAQAIISNLSRPGRLTAGISYYRATLDLIAARAGARLPMPVMGVFSDGDRFLTERQMVLSADYVAGPFRYERLVGVGHWLQRDAPEAVNALLLDFLSQETA